MAQEAFNRLITVKEIISIPVPKEYPIALFLVGGISFLTHYTYKYYDAKRKEYFGRYKFM